MKIFRFVFAVAISSFLVACGGGGGGEDVTNENEESRPPASVETLNIKMFSMQSPAIVGRSLTFPLQIEAPLGTTYTWDFGDLTDPVVGDSPTHVYSRAGSYRVKVSARSPAGKTASAQLSVTVLPNQAPGLPEISVTPPRPEAGAPFLVRGHAQDLDDDTLEYLWSFPGTAELSGAEQTASYPEAGSYTLHLTVRDSSGETSQADVTVEVVPRVSPPVTSDFWKGAPLSSSESRLYSLEFTDALTGFATGYEESETSQSKGLMFKTVDGGVSWKPIETTRTKAISAVQFTSASEGWAVGPAESRTEQTGEGSYITDLFWGVLLHTTNGGQTWNSVRFESDLSTYFNQARSCGDMAFQDPRNGWIVCSAGGIYHTSDGGSTWQRQNFQTESDFTRIQALDSQRAWITSGAYGSLRSAILRTEDGGMTWTSHNVGGLDEVDNILDMHFIDATHGWVLTERILGSRRNIYRTEDGGKSWQAVGYPRFTSIGSLRFIDARTGYALDELGQLWKTGDAGDTWTEAVASSITLKGMNNLRVIGPKTLKAIGYSLTGESITAGVYDLSLD